MEEIGWGKNKNFLEVTNVVDSQPHECQPTGMPTAHAKTTSLHVYPHTNSATLAQVEYFDKTDNDIRRYNIYFYPL